MSLEAVAQFREAVSANEEWQEEIRNFGADDNMVDYAQGKGHAFSEQDYNTYVSDNKNGEVSEFEMELRRRWQLRGYGNELELLGLKRCSNAVRRH